MSPRTSSHAHRWTKLFTEMDKVGTGLSSCYQELPVHNQLSGKFEDSHKFTAASISPKPPPVRSFPNASREVHITISVPSLCHSDHRLWFSFGERRIARVTISLSTSYRSASTEKNLRDGSHWRSRT